MGLEVAGAPFVAVLKVGSPFDVAFVVDITFALATRRILETPAVAARLCFSLVLEVSDRESSTPARGR